MSTLLPPHRKTMRLDGFDYAQNGKNFVTLVTQGRERVLGEVREGEMRLSHAGHLVRQAWLDLPRHYANMQLDLFCIMPNHFHGIVFLLDTPGRGGSCMPAQLPEPDKPIIGNDPLPVRKTRPYDMASHLPGPDKPTIGKNPLPVCKIRSYDNNQSNTPFSEIIRAVKSFSTRRIHRILNKSGQPLWQRNYYDHIIRDESDLQRVREYIQANPARWEMDEENIR